MRILKNTALALLIFIFSTTPYSKAQSQQLPENQNKEQYEKLRQPLLKTLKILRTSYPNQKYLKDLQRDIRRYRHNETVGLNIKLTPRFDPLGYDSIDTAMRIIHVFLVESSIPLPTDFFSLSSCEQKIIIELLAITYQYNYLSDTPGEKLPDDMLKILRDFTDPNNFPSDPNETESNKLIELINKFEKLAINNADNFSTVIFDSCSVKQVERLFFGPYKSLGISHDRQVWTKIMQERLHQKFEAARISLIQ